MRTYAPYVVLPFAAVIGVIGYSIESSISDKYTPWRESVVERREQRLIQEAELLIEKADKSSNVESLKNPEFVPKNIFQKNVSPSLSKD